VEEMLFAVIASACVSSFKGTEACTAERSVPGPIYVECETAIAGLKKCKSACSDQVPAEMNQARGETLVCAI
jgi:hypothetical protein